MRVVFYCPWANAAAWLTALCARGPEFAFVPWSELTDPAAIEAAVVWRPPPRMLEQLPGLRVICAMGAGVDYLFAPGLDPPAVPIVRLVDPVMSERMASYVLAAVLYHQRQLGRYREQQRERMWRQMMHSDTADVRIGIMGLGPMGRASAQLLKRVGYDVAGWSRWPRSIAGVRCFAGRDEFDEFLGRSDFLVCLLSLTPATRGILSRATFDALPEGAVVINAARGDHLIEADLLAALDAGRLAGAVLDVSSVEPLPGRSPAMAPSECADHAACREPVPPGDRRRPDRGDAARGAGGPATGAGRRPRRLYRAAVSGVSSP